MSDKLHIKRIKQAMNRVAIAQRLLTEARLELKQAVVDATRKPEGKAA